MKILRFVQELGAQVSDAPEQLLETAVRTSIRRLCDYDVYQLDLDPISERAGVHEYELSPPSGVIILKVLGAYRKGKQLNGIPRFEFEEAQLRQGTPEYFMRNGAQLDIAPTPKQNERNAIEVRASVSPTRSSSELADEVAEAHFDTIVRGAMLHLLEMPNKSWSSPTTAALYRQQLATEYLTARRNAKRLGDGMRIISRNHDGW